jgi:hypothetical protein
MKTRLFVSLAVLLGLILIALIWNSRLADIRPDSLRNQAESETTGLEAQGRYLIERAWKAQGMDSFFVHDTYTAVGTDEWKGLLGQMGKLWPEAKARLKLDFDAGTFTSRVTFLDGKRQGDVAGQQDWAYYEIRSDHLLFQEEPNPRLSFGLSAFQYFFELIDRLDQAPIVYYAGQERYRGKNYDLVFATWDTPAPHPEHDQYLLYLDSETHRLQAASYTVRDNYLPGASPLYGSILFDDFRQIEGAWIPFRQTVFLNGLSEKTDQFLHELTLDSFAFDTVAEEDLYPKPSHPRLGDAKPAPFLH